tara:strand:- start:735 stop:872 length:138 start_codon:yes stop_codon:yes gene_type:complete
MMMISTMLFIGGLIKGRKGEFDTGAVLIILSVDAHILYFADKFLF